MDRRFEDAAWTEGADMEVKLASEGAIGDPDEINERLKLLGAKRGNEVEAAFNRGRIIGKALSDD